MVRVVEMRTVPTWGEGDYIIFFSGHAVSNCARITNFLLNAWTFPCRGRVADASNAKIGQDYSPAGHLFSATARWGVPLAGAFIKYLFFMIESWLLLFTGSWTSLI